MCPTKESVGYRNITAECCGNCKYFNSPSKCEHLGEEVKANRVCSDYKRGWEIVEPSDPRFLINKIFVD